jgi:hypothetical protein
MFHVDVTQQWTNRNSLNTTLMFSKVKDIDFSQICKITRWVIANSRLFEFRIIRISRHPFSQINSQTIIRIHSFRLVDWLTRQNLAPCHLTNNFSNLKSSNQISWNPRIPLNYSSSNRTQCGSMLMSKLISSLLRNSSSA